MGQCAGDAIAASWFLAAVQGPAGDHADHADGTHPDVIISVSLDELDGLSGDMLV
jgi:hypothetical protein